MKTVFITTTENQIQLDNVDFELDRWDAPVVVIRARPGDIAEILLSSALCGLEDEHGDGTSHVLAPPTIVGGEEIVIDESLPTSWLAFFLRKPSSWGFKVKTWTPEKGIQDL